MSDDSAERLVQAEAGVETPDESIGARMYLNRRQFLRASLGAAVLSTTKFPFCPSTLDGRAAAESLPIQNAAFKGTWQRTDQLVAQGKISRTWMWGPAPFTNAGTELYAEAPNGLRLVQYFDKARMELNAPNGDPNSPWFVTNGLLAKELVTGQIQLGNTKFLSYTPASTNVAGDADDPDGPTYATFSQLLGYDPLPNGWTITQTIDRAGKVGSDSGVAKYDITAVDVGAPTKHTVASVFWDFMNSSGPTWSGGIEKLFPNPFYAVGYPLSEPYWATVRVGGKPHLVLVQVFERRVLTYTPDNPPGWQVEAGNVGQHYYAWRYGRINDLLPPPSFRDLASNDGMLAGTVVSNALFENFQWRQIVQREFDFLTIDGWGLSWYMVEPRQGQFTFDSVDMQVAYAQANGANLRGQALVFHSEAPDWLKQGNFSRSDAVDIVKNHVTQIVSRYKGTISQWVVVNEPYFPPYRTDDVFHELIGDDYIDIAFQAARVADPSAQLLYNDSGNETAMGFTTQLTHDIVGRLRTKNLIDGVGLQMHLDGSKPPNEQDVKSTMQSYGIPVYVTEFDIDLQTVPGTQKERFAIQAQIAGSMVRAARESGACRGFNLWDIGDTYSWINWMVGHSRGDATPLDENLDPKPMFGAMIDTLK